MDYLRVSWRDVDSNQFAQAVLFGDGFLGLLQPFTELSKGERPQFAMLATSEADGRQVFSHLQFLTALRAQQ
jgi:hypothetical protein